MAQKRMLNKSISLSGQVNKLKLKEKLLFTWSIPHLDDYGLLDSDPEVIKATVVPMIKDITIKDIKQFVKKIEEVGLAILYQDCIEFSGFDNHQSISAEKRAKMKFQKIPIIPQENFGENNNPQESPKKSGIIEDKIREDKIREDNQTTALAVVGDIPEGYKTKEEYMLSDDYLNSLKSPTEYIMELFRRALGVSPAPVKSKDGKDLNHFACMRIMKKFGKSKEEVRKKIEFILKYQKQDKYCRMSVNPLELEQNYSWYKTYLERKSIEINGKKSLKAF